MSYDPINDEKKLFSADEWQLELSQAIAEYVSIFRNKNDFHKSSHTFNEWMASFHGFMSW